MGIFELIETNELARVIQSNRNHFVGDPIVPQGLDLIGVALTLAILHLVHFPARHVPVNDQTVVTATEHQIAIAFQSSDALAMALDGPQNRALRVRIIIEVQVADVAGQGHRKQMSTLPQTANLLVLNT